MPVRIPAPFAATKTPSTIEVRDALGRLLLSIPACERPGMGRDPATHLTVEEAGVLADWIVRLPELARAAKANKSSA